MPSTALQNLRASIWEVRYLQQVNPTPTGAQPSHPTVTRVIGRASIVLLSSHLERYIRAVNEEAVSWLNQMRVTSDAIPEEMRLLHLRKPIDDLAQIDWNRRGPYLAAIMLNESCLWRTGDTVTSLNHDRFLEWMSSPKCENLIRYYRQWSISDIFNVITIRKSARAKLWLRLTELVDKRNGIAHGDFSVQATQQDVKEYTFAAQAFCILADRAFARHLGNLFSVTAPW